MCQFLSALALKNGDVLTHPMLDSHSDLVTYFQLPDDTAHHQHFAKVELQPQDWLDVSTWQFRLDEETEPGWWPDVAGPVEQTLRDRAARMILREGEHRLIVDGAWIVGGTAVVRDVRAGRIMRVQDSAQIHDVSGSAQIHDVRDSAQIRGVRDSAQIHDVRGSGVVLDSSARARVVAQA
jgi:hypothetical protein